MATSVIAGSAAIATPVTITNTDASPITPRSVSAVFDGTAAASEFIPCLSFYTQDNRLIGRYKGEATVPAGDTAQETFAPFLGKRFGAADVTLPVLGLVDFNPAAGFIQVTSTNPAAPTDIVASSSIAFDGLTTVKVEFYAAAADFDQRGKTALVALLLELYVDSTASGIVYELNAAAGEYEASTVYCAAFDTPSAGSHTYSIKGYQQNGAGTVGNTFVYGSNIATAHATRPGFLAIFKAST